ncbi:hypothetical protein OHR68_32195 [Spirillospora sp. NBC_00431]
MDPETLPEVPQDEFELVGRLYPESAWMFVWGRRVLHDLAGDRVSRFLVGALEPGCWSVLGGDTGWFAIRCADETTPATPSHAESFESAQDAVAYAVAGVAVDANVSIHTDFLRDLDVLDHVQDGPRDPFVWALTDEGQRLAEVSRDEGARSHAGSVVDLEPVLGSPLGYRVCPWVPRPDSGPSISVHALFRTHVQRRLPGDFGASTGDELPADLLLDSYATADEPYVFTLDTPFHRRSLPRTVHSFARKLYVVRRPIRAYPGFPVREATVPAQGLRSVREPASKGQGYLLPGAISAMVRSGAIEQISEAEATHIYQTQRQAQSGQAQSGQGA